MGDKTETLRAAAQTDAPAAPETITSRIYARLKADILDARLNPGSKLKIDELRAYYGAGASPIREALSHLASDRLVERLDQRGFRVAKASGEEFSQLLKTRCWLEERALRESIANGDTDWEERIVLAPYRLSSVPRSKSADKFVFNSEWEVFHKAFHMALIAACGSTIMLRYCDELYEQNIRYRALSDRAAFPDRDLVGEHEAIKEATLARNADLAVQRLFGHYTETGKYLMDSLDG